MHLADRGLVESVEQFQFDLIDVLARFSQDDVSSADHCLLGVFFIREADKGLAHLYEDLLPTLAIRVI